MKKITLFTIFLFSVLSYAQVGINTNTPDSSSALDIESTTGGILIPRLTETQRDAISSPATGLMIYQTDQTTGFYFYNGIAWTRIEGVAGPQGEQGPQGIQGETGPTGATGPQGPQGIQGVAGADGTNGSDGAEGTDGSSAYEIWVSAGNTGTESDFLASLVGAQGEQGPQGLQGDTGAQGLQGPTGPQGPQGLAGADGATGPAGPQGEQGPVGLPGDTGAQGLQGPTGPQGPQGDIGATGATGADGAQGPAGPQGATGTPYTQPTYTVNTFYAELGGYVIQISPSGKHGVVAAMQDQGTSSWYEANNLLSNPNNHDSNGMEFSDWRLPTLRELNLMYDIYIGGNGAGFVGWNYSCSTSLNYSDVWYRAFNGGSISTRNKNLVDGVRAVRDF